jgi:hypothetical protein
MKLDLFETNEQIGMPTPVHPALRATKQYPPACGAEGITSPCNGRLFAWHGSSDNIQWVTGSYFSSKYLAKYAASIDEHNQIIVGAGKHPDELKLELDLLLNTKRTGNVMHDKARATSCRDLHHPNCRAISMPEQISVLLGYEQIYTTFKFHHCPTVPLEERPGNDRIAPLKCMQTEGVDLPPHCFAMEPDDLDSSLVVPTHAVREVMMELHPSFPLWRTLSYFEQLTLKDQLYSPISIDAITVFSGRPPELRFVDSPKLYFKWVYQDVPTKKPSIRKSKEMIMNELNLSLQNSAWIDGFSCRVYVRPDAISEICDFISYSTNEAYFGDGQFDNDIDESSVSLPKRQTKKLFFHLQKLALTSNAEDREEDAVLRARFICPKSHLRFPLCGSIVSIQHCRIVSCFSYSSTWDDLEWKLNCSLMETFGMHFTELDYLDLVPMKSPSSRLCDVTLWNNLFLCQVAHQSLIDTC